ncbi:MAG: type 1 glutamine amidotransferase domain-containing protein, partial [Chitinophagaceae bacterium]
PIGAVCQGVAALLSLQNSKGEVLIRGRRVTGFSNSEERSTGLAAVVPFLLETELVSLGAGYSSGVDYTSYVIADDNLITGQNPASSEDVAKKILLLLKSNAYEPALPSALLN